MKAVTTIASVGAQRERWRAPCSSQAGMAVAERAHLGILGETAARDELERRGYAILATRYRTRRGEIDIVACHRGCIVFVEVKTRRHGACGAPVEAITPLKRRRMTRVAEAFLADRGWGQAPCRFDVVSVWSGAAGTLRIDVLEGAF